MFQQTHTSHFNLNDAYTKCVTKGDRERRQPGEEDVSF